MSLFIIKDDITTLEIDCIVNAANENLTAGGGVCGAIHDKAGPELNQECRKIRHCGVGESRITKGYNLPAKHIIHTVGPVWHGGKHFEDQYLFNCYKKSLLLATHYQIKKIAFPNISIGIYGYSKDQAAEIALKEVKFHQNSDRRLDEVIFCCFDDENYDLYNYLLYNDTEWEKAFNQIGDYMGDQWTIWGVRS